MPAGRDGDVLADLGGFVGQTASQGCPKRKGGWRGCDNTRASPADSHGARLEAPGSCSSSELRVSLIRFSLLERGLNQEFGLMVLPLAGYPQGWAEAAVPEGEVSSGREEMGKTMSPTCQLGMWASPA